MSNAHSIAELYKQYKTELFQYVLPFWENNSPDVTYGGIYNCLDSQGRVFSTDKSVWAQGRAAWVFSRLARNYPEHEAAGNWTKIAKSCLGFLDEYCIDKADRRMYFLVTEDGKPLRKRRYYFSETFYIIGCAEYSLLTGESRYLETARAYYDFVLSMYRDAACDPYKVTPKIIAATRAEKSFANPMILLNVTDVLRRCDPDHQEHYDRQAKLLIEDIHAFIRPEYEAVLENIGVDNTMHDWHSAGRVVNPGHAIEASWFLYSQAQYSNDNALKKTAMEIFDWSLARGWDEEYGGLYYFTDLLGHPPEQYEHDMKLWWPHCEALIAALMFYQGTGEPRYLDLFQKFTDYTFSKFSDHDSGDWYGYLRRDGMPTMPACKGSTYKSGFHVIRMLDMVVQMLGAINNSEG